MALTKEVITDKVEVVGPYRAVQCREATIVKEDGKVLSRSFRRHALYPSSCKVNATDVDGVWVNDDPRAYTHTVTDISGEPQETQDICNAVWTDDIKAAYKTYQEEQSVFLGL